ncbi:MAG: NAD(P)-dependent oxidoreductase [Verrucomicrobia bacterium]|nr:MAG: NAD(P)-dependent oxidoreductase [Verrucomicrobiota bacterium]
MVIADTVLAQRERDGSPVRVAMVGAGVTARMIALQLATPIPGIRLVAIANRTVEKGTQAFSNAGVPESEVVLDLGRLEENIDKGVASVVEEANLVCQAQNIDVIVEVTGTVEFGSHVAFNAIHHRKHVILVNAELDSTVGPILKFHAERAGVVLTNTDGDEPGVAMTLLRYLRSVGLRPVAAGNLKGIIDRYRTPDTQREFATKYKQDAAKVTSFADGTKLSMEACILANATGFKVGQRGMYGPKCAHVREMAKLLPLDELLADGLVDYALGAEPHTGAFVIVHEEHPRKQKELAYYKLGDGPCYVFYTPYHLPHIQIASTIARAALFGDATVSPLGGPVCEVITIAKRNLQIGDVLDGVGGFMAYGVIENAPVSAKQNLLPMGVSEGCRLVRNTPKDRPITYDDIELPQDRLCDQLRTQQCRHFRGEMCLEEMIRSPN